MIRKPLRSNFSTAQGAADSKEKKEKKTKNKEKRKNITSTNKTRRIPF